jgi:hypothetical protein
MKNLSTCKPSEFLTQTIKIKNLVKNWLDATKILDIRKNMPKIDKNLNPEERTNAIVNQALGNWSDMLDKMFIDNAEKTLALLALVNFVEPQNVDDYEMGDYLESIGQLLNDKRVLSFFSSLIRLNQQNI